MSEYLAVIPDLSEAYRMLGRLAENGGSAPCFETEIESSSVDLEQSINRFNSFVSLAMNALEAGKPGLAAEEVIRLRVEAMNIASDFKNLAEDIAGLIRSGYVDIDKT